HGSIGLVVTTLIVSVLAAAEARGGTIYLTDGSRLDGDVKKSPGGGYVLTDASGKQTVLALDKVKSIELGVAPGAVAPPDRAKANLESLRRSVEYLDDSGEIIKRYQRFVEQSIGSSIEDDARQDLAAWQDRREQGLVKFGTKWVTPADRAALQEKALRQADAARKSLRDGKLADAESLINQALTDDPQNPTALYLRGLLQFKQDQIQAARKSFEQVSQVVGNHGPTLNNLAVVMTRQNQFPASLNAYDAAMIASPKSREILNNMAEAIWNLPDAQRDTPIAQRVLRRFNEQDVELANELGPRGLHRWGATWVTTEQMGQLKEAEKQAKDKLDRLSAEFDGVKVRIDNIDREIAENERSMRRLEASAYVRDINGQIWQSALPAVYGELQEDNRKLQQERGEQFARLDRLREQAKAVNRELPVAKYTGIQKMMDDTFAPIVPPKGAEGTTPATRDVTTHVTTQPT
ncbi:MAG: tetratricopeptide repeat protein, partial [Tepidisphaeraceae bacterium]